ncbi:MAG: formimidoylglutamate deiminase [Phycisphaerales bacterium]
MGDTQIIEADLTWVRGRFERDVKITVGSKGQIEAVGFSELTATVRLRDRAILPGMINTHSHAFQRGLRGRGETFGQGAGSFWSWRKAMYGLVDRMDEQTVYALSKQAFGEMLAAGITTVGEFHYLHHDERCEGYAFDEIVLKAAAEAGIRIVLLNAYYAAGGIGEPLEGAQRRFGSLSLDAFWLQMDRLETLIDHQTQSLGVVAHSIRAADIEDIRAVHEEAHRRGLVFHMHVEEQRKEIEDCVAHYDRRPMQLLNERLQIDNRFTAIHCTHTDSTDMDSYLAAGGNVCICPLTEANLGDGIADVPDILRHKGRICLGTDSNARISFIEEMRWLEYVQRLAGQGRGVCTDDSGSCASALWHMATTNGAYALAIKTGRVEAGYAADFVAIDLSHRSLEGWSTETLLDALVFGSSNEAIAATCVNGMWIESAAS